ncbi:hypothetical protein [Paractinoplanes rishiriensis]|uniref:Uncharacterized protein n=1 Tax=Paractinoplanes rishiriensis TaxID=1050105 RepID=A0A919K6T9_9ACTN|nr:hypothetical protein [Actinoplanes rishiriensis]GIF02016.1 hypothetical protein Ari01nite_94800 [Actinoplanes rishiriensis]
MRRDEAERGVEDRLATTVSAYPGLRVVTVPAQFLRLPDFATAAGGQRVLRGGRLPEVGDAADDVFGSVAELWRDAGCRVEDAAGLDGRLLVVHDPAGYLLTLTRHGADDPILAVASPPLPVPYLDRSLLGGLATGLAVGCLGPCVSSAGPSWVLPALAGSPVMYWAWVPLFALVAGVCLYRPETRRFGAGLLAGGGILGLAVAALFGG